MSNFDFDAPLMPEGPVIPDSIEPWRGYKALNIHDNALLYSPSKTVEWPVGRRLEGFCSAGLSHWTWVPVEGEPRERDATQEVGSFAVFATASSAVSIPRLATGPKPNNPLPPGWNWSWEPLTHDAPEESCHCGIYAVSDPSDCIDYLGPEGVICEIALWGKVIPASSGARGQYAYPKKILVPTALQPAVTDTANLYGLDVDVLDLGEPVEEPPLMTIQPAQLDLPSDNSVVKSAIEKAMNDFLDRMVRKQK